MQQKIGIVGGGFVGSALKRYFEKQGYDVKVYDKFKKSDPLGTVIGQDFIFIAVPTPYNGKIDLSAMDEAMKNVSEAKPGTAVVIKSTVIPGTTQRYQKLYPHLKMLFNPEFLTELSAENDFEKPDRQIVGHTLESRSVAERVMGILPPAQFSRIIDSSEAELIKYFGNNWLAVRVAYANHMYDICEKLGLDYDVVKECASADPRIGSSHLDIWRGGYRGYGGKCLPKDIRAMIAFADDLGLDLKLLKATEEINNGLHQRQQREIPKG